MKKTMISVPLEVLENQFVALQTKIVYCVILKQLKQSRENGLIYDDLALKCGLTRKQLIQAIQELVELQLLEDHPSLHNNSLRREIRLGAVKDWNAVTKNPVRTNGKNKQKISEKVEK